MRLSRKWVRTLCDACSALECAASARDPFVKVPSNIVVRLYLRSQNPAHIQSDMGTVMTVDLTSAMLESIRTTRSTIAGDDPLPAADGGASSGASGFSDLMKQAVLNVDTQQHDASQQVAAVETGDSDDLAGAMLASQQASLSFSMMVQVRNKVMSAFDDIIKMQV